MDWNKLEQDAYACLSLTPHELYEFTYVEYQNMMIGYSIKSEQELKFGKWTAWHTADYMGVVLDRALGNKQAELPNLNDILSKPIFDNTPKAEPVKLSDEETFKQNRDWTLAMIKSGLPVSDEVKAKYNID